MRSVDPVFATRIVDMSITALAAAPLTAPLKPVDAAPPPPKRDAEIDITRPKAPPPPAALPPGQGARVDRFA
jgi:hypothetical protein